MRCSQLELERRQEKFIGGERIAFPEPDYEEILKWMCGFTAPSDEKEQLTKWLLSTRIVQGPKGLFYLIDSTVFHLGAWMAVAHGKFPRTHAEAYELLVSTIRTSGDYVNEIVQIRRNPYDNDDFGKALNPYFKGIEKIRFSKKNY